MKFGFVYLWYDTKHKKFYLGSHLGTLDDGYTGSNRLFKSKYKSRPNSFKRRILESHNNISSKSLLEREQIWLNLIKPQELCTKYYNEKNVASGGDIISNLSPEKKEQHRIKSGIASKKFWNNITPQQMEKRKQNAFGGNKFDREYLKLRNKELSSRKALIKFPDGTEKIITNIAEFCSNNELNYGNMKTMLRGGRKSCCGIKGYYL